MERNYEWGRAVSAKSAVAEKPRTILVADDDSQILELLGAMLEDLPVTVVQADNGLDAINLVTEKKPSLLIVDYQMPGWDGVAVCRHLKADPTLTGVKVLLITGVGTPPFLLEAVNHGLVDAALAKPFEVDEFVRLVMRLLELPAR